MQQKTVQILLLAGDETADKYSGMKCRVILLAMDDIADYINSMLWVTMHTPCCECQCVQCLCLVVDDIP